MSNPLKNSLYKLLQNRYIHGNLWKWNNFLNIKEKKSKEAFNVSSMYGDANINVEAAQVTDEHF